jgi:hypothetical protein
VNAWTNGGKDHVVEMLQDLPPLEAAVWVLEMVQAEDEGHAFTTPATPCFIASLLRGLRARL